MSIEQAVLENLRVLSLRKKEEVLEFTEFLAAKEGNGFGKTAFERDLSSLDENELIHLEMEFENYEELYPRQ